MSEDLSPQHQEEEEEEESLKEAEDGEVDSEEKQNEEDDENENDDGEGEEDEEQKLLQVQQKLAEMEEETARLAKIQQEVQLHASSPKAAGPQNSKESDSKSIYVGNVDYGTTVEELQNHFVSCGTIVRITIQSDKWTGHPKGFAYVEFADESSVTNALLLNESLFRGRQLKVSAKRTNVPGMARGGRGRGRGGYRGFRGGRGRGRRFHYYPY